MAYSYAEQRKELFTEQGQVMFLAVRDRVKALLTEAGAFMAVRAWSGVTGDVWLMLACLDRLVELGEIVCVSPEGTFGQHNIYRSSSL